MLSALFYACSFIFALCITIMYPKSDKKINGIVDGLFSYVSVTVLAAFLMFCFNLAKIPVSQITMGILFLLIGFVQMILIARKKKLQTHTWTKADFAALFLLVVAVCIVMLYVFTPYLHFNYYNNVDPSNHFLYAQSIIRSKKTRGLFFNSMYNAMFMQLITWALPASWAYKAFILSDIYHLIIELLFLYAAICLVQSEKKKRVCVSFWLSLGYWLSYLLFSFIWGFVYWTMAAMLVQYVLMLLYCRHQNDCLQKKLWVFVGLGFFAVTMCYIQFAPVLLCMIAAVVAYQRWVDNTQRLNRRQVGVIIGLIGTIILLGLFGYKLVFHDTGVKLLKALQMGAQQNIGLEILLLAPMLFYIMRNTFRERKRLSDLQVVYVALIVVQTALTVLTICNCLSTYYLQKSYIIILFVAILILLEEWEKISQSAKKTWGLAYLCILTCLVFSYDGGESKTISLQQSVFAQNMQIMATHDFSEGALSDNSKIYLMQYVAEEYAVENGATPLITSGGVGRGIGLWFDATYDAVHFIGIEDGTCTEEEMTRLLQESGAKSFFVFFDDLLYVFDLHDYFDSFERVYQNEAGFVARFE